MKAYRMIILFDVENFALEVGRATQLCRDVGDEAVVEDGAVVRGHHHRRTEVAAPWICGQNKMV